MRREIIHKQVMRVVHEEMQCVHHFSIVADEWHFNGLLDDLGNGGLGFGFFLQEFNLHLLLTLF